MVTELARKLRNNASAAERAFWRLTYSLRQHGWRLRRQWQVGTYYVDFACLDARLVIEIDGDSHGVDIARSNDATRDDYLAGRGFAVLRFSNEDVLSNPDGVFEALRKTLEARAPIPPPQPAPQGGGSHIVYVAKSRQERRANALPLAGRAGVGDIPGPMPDEDKQ